MPPGDSRPADELERLGRDCRRYSAGRLPSYRYMPGVTPHPLTHPQGHSYGKHSGPPEALPAAAWAESEAYLYGCDLYNRGYWWEAHEAWEGLWQVTRDRPQQHRFLQGLIQAANAQLKLAMGRGQAVRRLWAKAEGHWQAAGNPLRYMGLDLEDWRLRSAAYLESRLASPPLRHDLAAYPTLELQHFADSYLAGQQNTHYSA